MALRTDISAKNPFSRAAGETYDIVADEYGVSRSVAHAMRQWMTLKIGGFLPDAPQFQLGGLLKTILGAAGMTDNPLAQKFAHALEAINPLEAQAPQPIQNRPPLTGLSGPSGMA